MARQVTLCADDYGLSTGVDLAIDELARRGRAIHARARRARWQSIGVWSVRSRDRRTLGAGGNGSAFHQPMA